MESSTNGYFKLRIEQRLNVNGRTPSTKLSRSSCKLDILASRL